MRFERPLSLVCAAVLALTLAACTKDDGPGDASGTTSPGDTSADGVLTVPELPTAPDPTRVPGFGNPQTEAGRRIFLKAVFEDQQRLWAAVFADAGYDYTPATMTIFDGSVDTACGEGLSELGPFYCPADHGVYLDTTFFDALQRIFGMQGGFPEAYVVAHEMGHHVQNLLGVIGAVARAQEVAEPVLANQLSVRRELQADCYAGVWTHSTYGRDLLSEADLAAALHAAAVVGNDVQQAAAGVPIVPEDWTHGSAVQRQRWLSRGFTTGAPDECATFEGRFSSL